MASWLLGSMTPTHGLIECLGYDEFNEHKFDMISSLYCFTLWFGLNLVKF